MSNQNKKRRLNTGGATAFDSLLNLVAKTSPDPKKDNAVVKDEKKEVITNNPIVPTKEAERLETSVNKEIQHKVEIEEAAPEQSANKEDSEEGSTLKVIVNSKPASSNSETVESSAYTKKENELIKKFLSKRKSKGKTSPVLIDDLLKEKVDRVTSLFGVTTTSFLCNILEEHFKENKNTYLELVNKKEPFSL